MTHFVRFLVYSLFGPEAETQPAGAVEFVIYESIKIFLLLSVIIFIISAIRSYFPPERTKHIFSHKREFIGNILAALLGHCHAVCSCSERRSLIISGKVWSSK